MDDSIRDLITRGIDSKTIQDQATNQGMVTMRMFGAQQVLRGVTSVAEILRQTDEQGVASLEPTPT